MKKLLKLARASLEAKFSGSKVDLTEYSEFSEKQGVFVTLHKKSAKGKELRGCIGYPYPVTPLNKAVAQAAQAAGFEDYRFSPLMKSELDDVAIEISVLSVPEEIVGDEKEIVSKIKIGEDGLIIKSPKGSGLLLPQVFDEHKVDNVVKALEMTCEKAWLPKDAWKEKDCQVFKFQAEIISE